MSHEDLPNPHLRLVVDWGSPKALGALARLAAEQQEVNIAGAYQQGLQHIVDMSILPAHLDYDISDPSQMTVPEDATIQEVEGSYLDMVTEAARSELLLVPIVNDNLTVEGTRALGLEMVRVDPQTGSIMVGSEVDFGIVAEDLSKVIEHPPYLSDLTKQQVLLKQIGELRYLGLFPEVEAPGQ